MKTLMKLMLLLSTLMASACALTGCDEISPSQTEAEENPFSIVIGERSDASISIQNISSGPITLNEVTVNNGGCRTEWFTQSGSKTFQMGDFLYGYTIPCKAANVIQVDVKTDRGNFSYSFR